MALLIWFFWSAVLLSSTRLAVGAPSQDAASEFFAPDAVQTIHLEITAKDLDRMERALPQQIWVPGAFRWQDQTLTEVGIRYKGGSSSVPNSPHKRSFLIAFAEFKKGQRAVVSGRWLCGPCLRPGSGVGGLERGLARASARSSADGTFGD